MLSVAAVIFLQRFVEACAEAVIKPRWIGVMAISTLRSAQVGIR